MLYCFNAGSITKDSWIKDMKIGGRRMIGEVCHFIDFLTFISNSLPIRIYASHLPDAENLNYTVCINIDFQNGSIGIIYDFKEINIYKTGKPYYKKLMNQDKGQS